MKVLKYSPTNGQWGKNMEGRIASILGLHVFEEDSYAGLRDKCAVLISGRDVFVFGNVREYSDLEITDGEESFLQQRGFDCSPYEGNHIDFGGVITRLKALRRHAADLASRGDLAR